MFNLFLDLLKRAFASAPQAQAEPTATPPVAPVSTAQPPIQQAPATPPAPAVAPTVQQVASGELDVRVQILNSILSTPHGKLDALAALHTDAIARDPLFYGHLAVWYSTRGEVRDHKVLFTAHLLTSDVPLHREAGWVLMQRLPPHMVATVLNHAKLTIGKVPRSLKSAVQSYLRHLEADASRFDRAALRSKQPLKHLYASLRIAPSARAQQVLFDDQPPPGSPRAQLKLLAKAATPAEQARMIVEHRIPYVVATGALKTMTPSVLVALVETMTPQETINHLASLKQRGAFDSPEVKALVEARLRDAEHDSRVSTLKATRAAAHVALNEETAAVLTEVTDKRVAQITRITRPTALLVDKSGSMTEAIKVAKEVAALVSAVCADFRVLAFDTESFEITAQDTMRSAWEQAFALVRANGGTSIGAPLDRLRRERHRVEQLVVITDCGENTAPFFRQAYAAYAAELGVQPEVTFITVGGVDQGFLTRQREQGIPLSVWEFSGDYYALPNILRLLSAPSRAELVEQVMAVALPRR